MNARTPQLSPSSLNLFLECPRCFWTEKNLGIKRPQPYAYAFNSEVDSLLKEEFDFYRKKKVLHPLFSENRIKARLFPNQKLINQWRNGLAGIRFYDEDLKAVLFGAPDDVLEFAGGKLAPLDYKSTGGKVSAIYDRFQLQMDTYAFLLEKNGFEAHNKAYLVFYVVDKGRGFLDHLPFRKEILEIETNREDVYEIFKDAVFAIRKPQPPPHSRDCQFGKWLLKAGGLKN